MHRTNQLYLDTWKPDREAEERRKEEDQKASELADDLGARALTPGA